MKSKLLLSLLFTSAFVTLSVVEGLSQGTWTQKANFGGSPRRDAVGFSIGTKGYIGTGLDSGSDRNDFWEYDPSNNVWTQKANLGGLPRRNAVGFSIGTLGYIGTGSNLDDLWEYDPSTNVWTQKANFGGGTRESAVGFSIGNMGYIGTGWTSDFWEWNQTTDTWTQKANFGGSPRSDAVGFSIGNKGYIGTGRDTINARLEDFWEWDQNTNVWSQKANYGGGKIEGGTGFSIGPVGYIGGGVDWPVGNVRNDIWKYNPVLDTWTQQTNFNIPLWNLISFSIGTKGYLGTGNDWSQYYNVFYEFTPSCNLSLSVTTTNSSCGQANGTASVTVTGGTSPYTFSWTNGDKASLADSLAAGLYMVYVADASGCTEQAAAMINDGGAPVITVTSTTSVSCNGGNNGAINIAVTGGTQPYTYLWGNGNTNQNMSNLQAGPHQVQVTDASGCIANKIIILNEPAKITFTDSIQNASCGNADGAAAVFVSGGTSPYTYLWNTSPPQTTQIATGLAAGGYSGIVTDANGCTKSGMVTIQNFGAPTVTLDSVHFVDCGSGLGDIYITASGGAGPPYTYAWSNGATTQNLVGVPPGNYGLSVTGGSNPCTAGFSGVLGYEKPYTPSICIVTVDTATGKNQCVFEKDSIANLGLKQYNFYRETTQSGVYQKLGSKAANLVSFWTDQSANPLQRAWRYKITAEDSCGNEAVISGMHKTIHLAANLGLNNTVNLIWDDYEGFAYSSFFIWRYTTAGGWAPLDTLPASLNSYTDLNPPMPLVDVYYYIEVVPPSVCNATIKNPDPMAASFNSSKSNVFKINPTPTAVKPVEVSELMIDIYPNPSKGEFTVSGLQSSVELSVYNVIGEKIYFKNVNGKQEVVNLNSANGIYFVKIQAEGGIVTRKIVLNK